MQLIFKNKLSWRWLLLTIAGVGLIIFSLIKLLDWANTSLTPLDKISDQTITHSTDKPGESDTTKACEKYSVPDDEPRKIELPSVGRSGCIERVGVDQDNAIAVPTNIHLAGWYVDSAAPGQEGVSIIDGHVLGRYNDAIFVDLDKLVEGDVIKVQFGDRSWLEFEVYDSKMYTIEQTAQEQFRQIDGVDSQLTLITCGGSWIGSEQTYDHRLVVRAALRDSVAT